MDQKIQLTKKCRIYPYSSSWKFRAFLGVRDLCLFVILFIIYMFIRHSFWFRWSHYLLLMGGVFFEFPGRVFFTRKPFLLVVSSVGKSENCHIVYIEFLNSSHLFLGGDERQPQFKSAQAKRRENARKRARIGVNICFGLVYCLTVAPFGIHSI